MRSSRLLVSLALMVLLASASMFSADPAAATMATAATWRDFEGDFEGDFGRDLLREHVKNPAH